MEISVFGESLCVEAVSLIVTLRDCRAFEQYARENNITFEGREDLCKNPKIIKMLTERINTLQQGLAGYEQVKRFTLLTKPFTMESGELTNTLKSRRGVIYKNYADVIEEMYKE